MNSGDETQAPDDAPLVQQIRFRFGGNPSPDSVNSQSLSVRDASGFPAPGTLTVQDDEVLFTPLLPLSEPASAVDSGGAGLFPDTQYFLRVSTTTALWIGEIQEDLLRSFQDPANEKGILIPFRTTADPARYFLGVPSRRPLLTATDPTDGSVDFSPGLYSDPAGLFAAPQNIHLHFDGPISPENLQLDRFALVDLDASSAPGGLPLGVNTRVLVNELDQSTVEITPSGILPFGHRLSVEYPANILSLGDAGDPGEEPSVAAVLFVSSAPSSTIDDHLLEDFDDRSRFDPDASLLEPGQFPAEWDLDNSDSLRAGFAFPGSGELGRFLPPPPAEGETRTVILDTSVQGFPLLDGSTPDAPPGIVVVGGVFSFTEIVIPDSVLVEARGANPLILSATGTVRIAGRINLNGSIGKSESAFDSAVTSLPGGAGGSGGGRGGESQPIVYFPPENISVINLVSPLYGGRGWGPRSLERIGGTGGQHGHRDNRDANGNFFTDSESSCGEFSHHNDALARTPGGGGGSHLQMGWDTPKTGKGNILPDGIGGWIQRTLNTHGSTWRTLIKGFAGDRPFSDGDASNDYIGVRGEHSKVFGGQGGGAGGSMTDAYYCGRWCKIDLDPGNDLICEAEFGNPPNAGDSVGDSRAGSGGGGGGALQIQALGPIILEQTASLEARGATGGGGEQLACACWGAAGGSGSGGAVILESAAGITVRSGAQIHVEGGAPRGASTNVEKCAGLSTTAAGAGGEGGHGIIQLQVPSGGVAIIEGSVSTTLFPEEAWVDRANVLNPAAFSPFSAAASTWFDMGRVISRPPENTNPLYFLNGIASDGRIPTDAEGNVIDPNQVDLRCDYLGQLDPLRPGHYIEGQEPRANFIPPNATILIQLQGAHAVTEGSKEVDAVTITPWSSDFSTVAAHQFVRYRVVFDITHDGSTLGPGTPRPTVQSVRVRSEF